jgi:hypothetical protein
MGIGMVTAGFSAVFVSFLGLQLKANMLAAAMISNFFICLFCLAGKVALIY